MIRYGKMKITDSGVGPPFRRAAIPKSPPFRKPSFRVCGEEFSILCLTI